MAGYEAMYSTWQGLMKGAQARLADASLQGAEKVRLEAFVKGPAPEYVGKALFYWGVVLEEFGKPDDAMTKYVALVDRLTKG